MGIDSDAACAHQTSQHTSAQSAHISTHQPCSKGSKRKQPLWPPPKGIAEHEASLRPIELIPTPGDSGSEGHPEEEVDNQPRPPPRPPPTKTKSKQPPRRPPPRKQARHEAALRPVSLTPEDSETEGAFPLPGQSEWYGKRPPGMPPMMAMMQGVQEEQNENAEDVEVYCLRCGRQFAPDFVKVARIPTAGCNQRMNLHFCFQETCRAAENLPPRKSIHLNAHQREKFVAEIRKWGSTALMDHEGGERHEEEVAKSAEPKKMPKALPITGKCERDEVCPRPMSKPVLLVVQLVTAGWKNLHLVHDIPIGAEPAPKWEVCPRAADMEAQLKRLVCPQALQACQLMCCVIYGIYYIYIYIYMYIRRLPYGVRFGPPSYVYIYTYISSSSSSYFLLPHIFVLAPAHSYYIPIRPPSACAIPFIPIPSLRFTCHVSLTNRGCSGLRLRQ